LGAHELLWGLHLVGGLRAGLVAAEVLCCPVAGGLWGLHLQGGGLWCGLHTAGLVSGLSTAEVLCCLVEGGLLCGPAAGELWDEDPQEAAACCWCLWGLWCNLFHCGGTWSDLDWGQA
jgi:hypothetical protein